MRGQHLKGALIERLILLNLILLAPLGCSSAACPDMDEVRDALQDPRASFPMFKTLVHCGLYSKAFDCLSFSSQRTIGREQFYVAMTSLETARRLICLGEVHTVDTKRRSFKLCNPEFGVVRDIGLTPLRSGSKVFYLIDLKPDDIEFFRKQALLWFKHQVKQADGFRFAYPPDWKHSSLIRDCGCEVSRSTRK